MQKHIIIVDNREIEIITNNIYPKIFGHFEKVVKRVVPKQPNIYRAFGLHYHQETENTDKDIIIAYGYPKTAYAENGIAYTISGQKIGNLADLPNLLNKKLLDFI